MGDIYFLYDAVDGEGRTCRTGQPSIVALRNDTAISKTWTHIVAGRFGGTATTDFLFYDAATGHAEFHACDEQGALSLLKSYTDWSPGHTHIVAGNFGGTATTGQSDLLIYDAATGAASFFDVWGQGNINSMKSYTDWSPGHTHIVAGNFGGTPTTGQSDLLIYDAATGAASFFDVWGQGNINSMKSYTDWSPGHTHIVAGNFGGTPTTGQSDLLIYDAATGAASFFDVWGQGNINSMKSYTDWSPGHTHIVAGNFGGTPTTGQSDLLIYDAASRNVGFLQVSGQGSIGQLGAASNPAGNLSLITSDANAAPVLSRRVPLFLPSRNGLHFLNVWPAEPDYTLSVLGQKITIGNASNGLCGGMVYTVKDCFQTGLLPPSDTTNPADGTPLFNYIVARLTNSFDEADVNQYLSWIQMSDHDTALAHGLAWHEITEEWPKIQADLDSGVLSTLGLVHGQEPPTVGFFTGMQDLGQCHQVLAWGYDLDGTQLTIYIYDPDAPGDGNTITLDIGDPAHTTPITVSSEPSAGFYRGFFRTHYDYHDPRTPASGSFIGTVVTSPGISPAGTIAIWSHADLSEISAAPAAADVVTGFTEQDAGYVPMARVLYRGINDHVYAPFVWPGITWGYEDLSAQASGTGGQTNAPGAADTAMGYTTDLAGQGPLARVVYRGADNHVHELSVAGGGQWSHADLTAITAAPGAADTAMGYTTDLAGQGPVARVVYRGADNHVHELSVAGGGQWSHADLTAITAAPAAADTAMGYTTDLAGQGPVARVVYRGADNHVHELSVAGGGQWSHADLTAITAAPAAADTAMGYTTDLAGQGPVARIVYRGADNHVHELSVAGGGQWSHADLTAITAAPAAADTAMGYTTNLPGPGPMARTVYCGTDNHVHELSVWGGGQWMHADLTAITSAPAAACPPWGYTTNLIGQNPEARVVYRDASGHVHELSVGA